MANVIAAVQQADAGHLAQQNAGRPALRRVQGVLSEQRGPLLRQLLRLLPARSVHPAARHLHREGRLDQRGDRPAAPGRHQLARQPAGCDHRGQRVVHLRLGFAEGLQGDDGAAAGGRDDRPRRDADAAGRYSVRPQRRGVRAEQVPRPRRLRGSLAVVRGIRLPHRALGRRGREALDHQPDQRRDAASSRTALHLPGQALRDAGGADRAGDRDDQAGARRAAADAARAGQAAGGPAAERPHAVRHRDDAGSGALPRHRELQPAALRPAAGLDARHAVRLLSQGFSADRRRVARHRAADPGDVQRRPSPQDDARRARLSAAERARQSAAEVRRVGAEDRTRWCSFPPRRATTSWSKTGGEVVEQIIRPDGAARSGDRSVSPPAARCSICWSRFASGPRWASGCWSPR